MWFRIEVVTHEFLMLNYTGQAGSVLLESDNGTVEICPLRTTPQTDQYDSLVIYQQLEFMF